MKKLEIFYMKLTMFLLIKQEKKLKKKSSSDHKTSDTKQKC